MTTEVPSQEMEAQVQDGAVATLASAHVSDGKVELCTLEISLPWDI